MRRMYSKPQLLEAVESESKLNGIKVFEDIKDKDGHARFLEGGIALPENIPSGTELKYGKWSLSGSHLMIVASIDLPNTNVYGDNILMASLTDLPQWIYDKIVAIVGQVVRYGTFTSFASDYTTQPFNVRLQKSSGYLGLIKNGGTTMTATRNVVITFDLLVDNE